MYNSTTRYLAMSYECCLYSSSAYLKTVDAVSEFWFDANWSVFTNEMNSPLYFFLRWSSLILQFKTPCIFTQAHDSSLWILIHFTDFYKMKVETFPVLFFKHWHS